jgi:hypothetical protein
MNDPQFVEAARSLAQRADRDVSKEESRAKYMFRLCTAREPNDTELNEIMAVYHDHLQEYEDNIAAARQLIAAETDATSEIENPSSLAAWTMIANLILNLDEVVTKN